MWWHVSCVTETPGDSNGSNLVSSRLPSQLRLRQNLEYIIFCPCVGLFVLLTNFSCKLWCKSNIQTKWRCVGFLWFFSWCLCWSPRNLDIVSHPTFPTSTCLCLRLLCLLPRRQGILQVLPRDFNGFHRWNIPKKSCQQCWKPKRIRISVSHKPFQCHTVMPHAAHACHVHVQSPSSLSVRSWPLWPNKNELRTSARTISAASSSATSFEDFHGCCLILWNTMNTGFTKIYKNRYKITCKQDEVNWSQLQSVAFGQTDSDLHIAGCTWTLTLKRQQISDPNSLYSSGERLSLWGWLL